MLYYPVMLKDLFLAGTDYLRLDHAARRMPLSEARALTDEARKSITRPFVLANGQDFERVIRLMSQSPDTYPAKLAYHAVGEAQKLCDTDANPPYGYTFSDGERLLEVSRCVLSRIMTLGFAYRVTGRRELADRALLEMDTVCAFNDWHTAHLLDAAEMAFAVSLGADWLYDVITPEKRAYYAAKVFEYEVAPATRRAPLKNWYAWSKTNWNTVCYSATLISLLEFSDFYAEEAARCLSKALYRMPAAFAGFEPDGVFAEGCGYWKYACSYYSYAVSSLRRFFGSDLGLSFYEGCKKVGLFPLFISTPCGAFNTGDNKNERVYSSSIFMFASDYGEPLLTEYQKTCDYTAVRPREAALGALWYPQEGTGTASTLPNAVHLRSRLSQEIVTVRSSYLDKNAFCFCIKGGNNFVNHGDLDIGTFVLESGGVRWAEESGPDDFQQHNYSQFGRRYSFFRNICLL